MGADRCGDTRCGTTNGSGSRLCCRGGRGMSAERRPTIGLFVEAVLYRYRAGIPWRDLPERFGDWKNTHQRFSRGRKAGVFDRIFKHLAGDPDNEYVMIDSTIVRAHQHSAGARKKGAKSKPSAAPEAA